MPPRKLLVDDIINFDYDGKSYTGNVIGISNVAVTPNGPFIRYAIIRSVFNEKLKTVKIQMSQKNFLKYKVELRFRPGQIEDIDIKLPQIKE